MLKKISKFLITLLPVLMIVGSIGVLNIATAADDSGKSGISVEALCNGENGLPCPEGDTGEKMAKNLVGKIVDNTRYIIGAIAILLIVISGVKLVFAQGNEEVLTKQTSALIFGVMGLFMVGLAGDIAQVFDISNQGFLKDPNATLQRGKLFSRTVEVIITFIKYIIGSVSVLFIIRNGLKMTMMSGSDEELAKDKKNIFYGFLGLIFILMANPIVNQVFFKIDTTKYPGNAAVRPGIDPVRLAQEIAGIVNLIAAIAGPFALLSLVAGGLMYVLAGDNEEKTGKAKKIVIWSIVGLVIIYGAFAIVNTFIARQFTGI